VSPILGNDAKTQGNPSESSRYADERHRALRKSGGGPAAGGVSKLPRRTHLVLKRVKFGNGPGISQKRIPKRSELVFLQPSPNYCEPDLVQGSLGTQGRYCNRTSRG
jgi:hypothetical protein